MMHRPLCSGAARQPNAGQGEFLLQIVYVASGSPGQQLLHRAVQHHFHHSRTAPALPWTGAVPLLPAQQRLGLHLITVKSSDAGLDGS
ncbi:hypothetical protein [Streptomyces sp. NRRL F-5122]|uniref:hypothetical protein n=1 Tax=Streptomyces sp. NRRL F-5122 TaxID=1609098 RepID=UPI000A85555C|nr:hypothetical protein [Streptomyces sp. NRRL F-5122]